MFWDTSALGAVLLRESRYQELAAPFEDDRELTIWWATSVECQSAIHRRHREAPYSGLVLNQLLNDVQALAADAYIVPPTLKLRETAGRLLGVHPLRAADALQLAAALVWCEGQASEETFVCLDQRLRDAARREGFRLLP